MKRLVVLGSGDAFATGGKYPTSFLLHDEHSGYLIDCGASTLVRLKQVNYPLEQLKGVFLTHFHGDHFGGLPFVLLALTLECDFKGPFVIAGPQGVQEKVRQLQELLYPGTEAFIDELGVSFVTYTQDWVPVNELQVQAVPVTHSPASSPHGLKFSWKGQMLAYSGDTEWDDHLISLASDTELFITECNNYDHESPGHLSLSKLVSKADLLKSKRIMLTHMGREVLELKSCPFERLYDGMEIALW